VNSLFLQYVIEFASSDSGETNSAAIEMDRSGNNQNTSASKASNAKTEKKSIDLNESVNDPDAGLTRKQRCCTDKWFAFFHALMSLHVM
jgi:hypothetical protein